MTRKRLDADHFDNPYYVAMEYGGTASASWHCWYDLKETDPAKAEEYRQQYLKERDYYCDFWDKVDG